MTRIPRHKTIEKYVGETPLVAAERMRAQFNIAPQVPLAYAGRLDPMASGKLLILIGDECKRQYDYHGLDKEYVVEVLLGVRSDTGDVLGIIEECANVVCTVEASRKVISSLTGNIELPYPHFSSKTVQGKPLHTWTLENRLNEIEIPTKKSKIYKIKFFGLRSETKECVLNTILKKIETIPEVTDPKKALGADFRRDEVRKSWNMIKESPTTEFQILSFSCTASSGTYMRSLAGLIGERLGTNGLAFSIHRTEIGRFISLFKEIGLWARRF